MLRHVHHDDLAGRTSSVALRRVLASYEQASAACGGTPEAAEVEAGLGECAASLIVLELQDDDLRYVSFGTDAAAQLGVDLTGQRVSMLPGRSGAFIRAAYAQALAAGHPLLAVQSPPDSPENPLWERLLLPCRHGQGLRLLVMVQPRRDEVGLLRSVLEASPHGLVALRALRDESGEVVDAVVCAANRRACDYLGHPFKTLIDGSILELVPALGEAGAWARCRRVIAEGGIERFDIQREIGGLDTWLQVTASTLGDGFLLSLTDITDLKYALFEMEVLKEQAERAQAELATEIAARQMIEAELRRIAVTDGLTGVLNRRGFDEIVRTMTATARRYRHALSVIAFDIDHFKRVNDQHGHAAGDAVLARMAMTVSGELREHADAVSRMGGEEFMVLLPHTDAAGAGVVAERLRQRVMNTPIAFGDAVIHVTASFGVCELPEGGDAERMLIEADAALYQAKQRGRNCVVTAGEAGPEPSQAAPGAGGLRAA